MTVQLTWDGDYVIVDGYTYRNHPKRLVLARWCKMVSMPRAVAVLERIVHEDRDMLQRLCLAFDMDVGGFDRPTSIADELEALLGPSPMSPLAPPGMFARMYVLERERTKPRKPAPIFVPQPQRGLEEIRTTVTLVGVNRWGNPLADLPFELFSARGAQQSSRLDGTGEAIESDVPSEGAEFAPVDIPNDHWTTRGAPPIGWLEKGVSIVLRDAAGEPLGGGANVKIVFANGATQSQQLDPSGLCRVDETPSCPLRIAFPDLDAESYE